jgi:hypothetical protein
MAIMNATLTMSGAELLAEPSWQGRAGIDVDTRTEFGREILCASVLVTSEVDRWLTPTAGIETGKLLESMK